MAVVRDYLITQFTLYGLSVFKRQVQEISDALARPFMADYANQLGMPVDKLMELTDRRKEYFKGLREDVSKTITNIENLSASISSSVAKLLDIETLIPTTAVSQEAVENFKRFKNEFIEYQTRLREASRLFREGRFAQSRDAFRQAQESANRASRLYTEFAQKFNRTRSREFNEFRRAMAQDLSRIKEGLSELSKADFAKQLGKVFDELGNEAVINRIARIRMLIMSIVGLAASLFAMFVSIARVMYNVSENIRSAYDTSVNLGMSLSAGFGLSRFFKTIGYDVSLVNNAIEKLSDNITKNKMGSRLMLGWLGLSPFELENATPLEALNEVLDRIMQLPDVSKRVSIGRELLGENFSQLLMLKETGILEELQNIDTYSKEFILNVYKLNIEWAKLKIAIQDIGLVFAQTLLPAITYMVSALQYLVKNQKLFWALMTLASVVLSIKKPFLGVPLLGLSIAGLAGAFKGEEGDVLVSMNQELRTQTRLMDLQYRTLNTLRMNLNDFLATTARGVPNIYQASVYRSLLINAGGF